VTFPRVDAVVSPQPRAESPSTERAAPSTARPVLAQAALPPRQSQLIPTLASNTAGLAAPRTSASFKLASARLRELERLAENVARDMGEAYDAVAGHFEAQIADARAEVDSLAS